MVNIFLPVDFACCYPVNNNKIWLLSHANRRDIQAKSCINVDNLIKVAKVFLVGNINKQLSITWVYPLNKAGF